MKNVEIIRGAIAKVTKMLAGMSIEVTQRGDQAFVNHDRRGKPVRVNIPYLPDNSSEELIAATQGFLDHEVAHILFSDGNALVKAHDKAEDKRLARTHNIVEDCWIEHLMERRFRGSAVNLGNVRKLVFDIRARPQFEKAQKSGVTEQAQWFAILSVTMFRALAGHDECRDFMDDGDKWSLIPDVVKAVDFFPARLKACKSSWDTLELARDVLDALKKIQPDADEDETPPEDAEGDGDGSDATGEKGDEDDGDTGAGDSESEESGDGDADDDGEASSDGDEDGDADDDDGDGKSSGSKDEDADGDGEDDADASSDGDADDGDSGDDGDAAGDEEGSGEADGEDDAGSGDEGERGGGDGDVEGKHEDVGDEEGERESDLFLEPLDHAEDYQDTVKRRVGEVYQEQSDKGDFGRWRVFSRDRDEPEDYQVSGAYRDEHGEQMQSQVRAMIGPMAKKLERLIQSRRRTLWEPGLRRGRLNPSSLHRLRTGDDRVFRRKIETRIKNTAVEILVDMSGSMYGDKMTTAIYASYALAAMLERVSVPCEVFSFSTKDPSPDYKREMEAAAARLGIEWSHQQVCNHVMFKRWNERLTAPVVKRFADMGALNASHLMSQNCDPDSLEVALRRLSTRTEERRILLVLSDGHPAFFGADYGHGPATKARMKELIKGGEAAGMEIVGIGIEDSAVRDFYPKHVILKSVADLPGTIMGEMQRMLLK